MTRQVKKAVSLKLYWVESPEHHEDWFVIARTARTARAFFETFEGYNSGDATSRLVTELPETIQSETGPYWTDAELGGLTAPCWPSEEAIKACCGVYVMNGDTRVVQLGGHTYAEGMLEAEIRSLQASRTRPSGGTVQ